MPSMVRFVIVMFVAAAIGASGAVLLSVTADQGRLKWLTGWWTPGWGNLFLVLAAAAGVYVAFRNTRLARQDARTEKLRAEIAALDTAVDEQISLVNIMLPRLFSRLSATGFTDAAAQIADGADPMQLIRQAVVEAKTTFEEVVSPIYRRIATHTFAVQMLTEDQKIIKPVKQIETLAIGLWHELQEVVDEVHRNWTTGALPTLSFPAGTFPGNKVAMPGIEQPPQPEPPRDWEAYMKQQQVPITQARDELRKYALEHFPKMKT